MLTLRGHKKPIDDITFSPDGNFLASAAQDRINVWDLTTGKPRWHVEGEYYSRIAFSPNGRWIAVSTDTLTIRKSGDGKPLPPLKTMEHVGFCAFARNGKQFALAAAAEDFYDRTYLCRWRLPGWNALKPIPVLGEGIEYCCYSPNGREVATITKELLAVWNSGTGKQRVQMVLFPRNEPRALEWSPDGQYLVFAAGPVVSVRDVKSLKERIALRQPKGYCLDLAFHPTGRWLATVGKDGVVRMWDTSTWKVDRSYAWRIDGLRCVAFARDGLRAACAGDKRTIVVWDVDD